MARQLVERLSQGGGGGAPGGGAGDASPAGAGSQMAQQFSQLQGADPQMGLKALTQMKQMMVVLHARYAFEVPAAARHISQALKGIDSAMKEMQEAAATVNVVGQSPIVNNAAMPQPQPDQTGGM